MTLMTADLEKKFEKYPFTSQKKEGMNDLEQTPY